MANNAQLKKAVNNIIIPKGFKLVRTGWLWTSNNKVRFFSKTKMSCNIANPKPLYILEKI